MVRIFMREARKDNCFSYIYTHKTYSLLELKKIHVGRICIKSLFGYDFLLKILY